jgi:hypothetical protein
VPEKVQEVNVKVDALLFAADGKPDCQGREWEPSGDSHFHEGRPLAVQTLTTTLQLPHPQHILYYFKVSDHKSRIDSICQYVAVATNEAQISPFPISTSKACIVVVRSHTCRKTPVSSHQTHLTQLENG